MSSPDASAIGADAAKPAWARASAPLPAEPEAPPAAAAAAAAAPSAAPAAASSGWSKPVDGRRGGAAPASSAPAASPAPAADKPAWSKPADGRTGGAAAASGGEKPAWSKPAGGRTGGKPSPAPSASAAASAAKPAPSPAAAASPVRATVGKAPSAAAAGDASWIGRGGGSGSGAGSSGGGLVSGGTRYGDPRELWSAEARPGGGGGGGLVSEEIFNDRMLAKALARVLQHGALDASTIRKRIGLVNAGYEEGMGDFASYLSRNMSAYVRRSGGGMRFALTREGEALRGKPFAIAEDRSRRELDATPRARALRDAVFGDLTAAIKEKRGE